MEKMCRTCGRKTRFIWDNCCVKNGKKVLMCENCHNDETGKHHSFQNCN